MLSGGGLMAVAAAKAWWRLVPPSGAVWPRATTALSSVAPSFASSQTPSVPARTGRARVLKT